jgi:light-regulated signal transduction histidine kinase (bacteriophytochrome)
MLTTHAGISLLNLAVRWPGTNPASKSFQRARRSHHRRFLLDQIFGFHPDFLLPPTNIFDVGFRSTRVLNSMAACEASAAAAENQGVEIELDVPEELEELPLERARMERVLFNLIANALEAMPDGGKIRIAAHETADGLQIEVEDNGPGIPAEIRARLFEPFVTAGKKEGMGLGLALARQAVVDHGGDLWTEPAQGARFVIRLPRKITK